MPQHLLKRAHGLVTAQTSLMDGQLYVADVLLTRGDPTNKKNTPADEAQNWTTVLTAGYGLGGYGYAALDVTNPDRVGQVGFLWEISKDDRCRKGSCLTAVDGEANDFGKFGLTTARPAYGTAFVSGKEVAIAFLPGGDTDEDPARPEAGKVVYIVRLDTGAKLAEFSEQEGNVFDLGGGVETLDFPFTSSASAFSDAPGVVTTRAFVGDAGGRLWRIDMSAATPSDWVMQLFFDPYAPTGPIAVTDPADRQPVMGAPKLALDGQYGHVAVVYGTGALDYLASAPDARAGMFSVSEVTALSGAVSRVHNWTRAFARGEKLTGEPEIFNKKAFFTTFVENLDDSCDGGSGRLYGVHFTERDDAAPDTDNAVAALDADGDPTTLDMEKFISTGDSIPYGVQVIERPGCFPGGTAGSNLASQGGGVKRGALELVVNVAHGDYSSSSTVPPGVDASKLSTKTFTHALNEQTETLQSAAWGNVLY
jgi:hypothetical protein